MTDAPYTHDATVIGCGLMGAAIARTLAESGLSVAAWNRTHSKAEALSEAGITAIRDISDATAAAPLVIACTAAGYDGLRETIAPTRANWTGMTFVNLTSGSPDEADELSAHIEGKGARYLDGMIVCYPKDIGADDAFVCYSGSPEAWTAHEATLMKLGGASRHVSADSRGANVMTTWYVQFYVTAVTAYVEAIGYAVDQGVTREQIDAFTPLLVDLVAHAAPAFSEAVASGDHATNQATIDTFLGDGSVLAQIKTTGRKARVYSAAVDSMTKAIADGLGDRGLSALALSDRQ
ncbi:NAD(P)-dependent oxidoreductase [Rhodococcus koreensis]